MSFYVKLFNLALVIIKSPITRQLWTRYTGKPLTAQGFYEVAAQTRTFQKLQQHAEKGVKGAFEAAKFDPKNPNHYRPQAPEEYNPFATHLKAFKAAINAAKEAVDAESKGQQYKPSYPVKNHNYQPPAKPITKTNRLIDHK